LRWALFEAAQAARRPGSPTASTTTRPPTAWAEIAPASPWPQALESQLPHPARARRRRPAPRLTSFGARPVLHQPDAPRPAPRMPLPPPVGGRPPKIERPQRASREDPITHHVTDPTVADRDKPGHSRAPHPVPPPRPQPAH
jgi:hypothetical protein